MVPSCVTTFSFILVQFSLLGGGGAFFNEAIIPLTLVRYEMIISTNLYPTRARGLVVYWRAISRHSIPRVMLENEPI